jgi:beta-glucosidase
VVVIGNHPRCGENEPWASCPLPEEGREAVDRKSLNVQPAQLELVQAVFAANPRTIVVLVSSFPQALGWIDEHIPAVVHSANSGQEIGTAIADVLFGDVEPGARTTMTWYRSLDDIPPITEYDIRKGLTYQYFGGTPLYPFGHGLSYTTFAYANLAVGAATVASGDATTVAVDVTNTGTRAGDEVVQLYVAYPDAKLVRPRQQLRGFRRIHLAAGETRTVTFPLAAEALTHWDVGKHTFVLEAGTVEIQVGRSAGNILLRGSLVTQP